ncbi:MAG: alkaline phosphatase D family protein [Labilithrix sp.]|nr:alkaline phosphatase D family protein [Labilithrix sp.]MCW5816396.1 alkaline phosphatase D family protein [Labilithrix sp.]
MKLGRRQLLQAAAASSLACRRKLDPPRWGVQSGDVDHASAVIWSRAAGASRMKVEWSLAPSFDRVTEVLGPIAHGGTDFTAKVRLTGLPSGTPIHYRAWFDDGERLTGRFATAPLDDRSVLLAWSADVAGQGWGIDPSRGGMPAFRALREREPDLFIHCGDAIYADEAIPPELVLPDGGVWRNVLEDERRDRARSLEDFRAAWRYPRRSAEVLAFSAAVPIVSIWDDHEVTNDWIPGQTGALEAHGRRAMFEHTPTLRDPSQPMYRKVAWGPLVDVFLLDGRSYRSPNDPPPPEGEAGMLGAAQVAWLTEALRSSRAVWKFVANGQPIADGFRGRGRTRPVIHDSWSNGNGPPAEREHELARLLGAIRGVKNVVWLAADVHYCGARRFSPEHASYKDFDPFWELIAGPLHAAHFPANPLDDTFGPEAEWTSAGEHFRGTPADGEQYFGLLAIDGKTHALTVTFADARGHDTHRLTLPAARD